MHLLHEVAQGKRLTIGGHSCAGALLMVHLYCGLLQALQPKLPARHTKLLRMALQNQCHFYSTFGRAVGRIRLHVHRFILQAFQWVELCKRSSRR